MPKSSGVDFTAWIRALGMSKSRSLYLLRHGQTEWNRAKRLQGGGDSPLTKLGRQQAKALARCLEKAALSDLLTSPLGRAKTTASIIADRLSIPLTEDVRLSEMRFGEAEGLTLAEIDKRWPGFCAEREQDKWRICWPNGECYQDVDQRLAPLVEERIIPLLSQTSETAVAIVGHESTNMTLLGRLLKLPPATVVRVGQPNDVIYRLHDQQIDHAFLGDDALGWSPGMLQKRSNDALLITS